MVRVLQRHYESCDVPAPAAVEEVVDEVLNAPEVERAMQALPSKDARRQLQERARAVARHQINHRFVARGAGYADITRERRARGLVDWEQLYADQAATEDPSERERLLEEALEAARERLAFLLERDGDSSALPTGRDDAKREAGRQEYARVGRSLATFLRPGDIEGAVAELLKLPRPTARGAARLWQDVISTAVRRRDQEGVSHAMAHLCDLLSQPGAKPGEVAGLSRTVASALRRGLEDMDPLRDADVATELSMTIATTLHAETGVRRYRSVLMSMAAAGHPRATVNFAARVVRDVPDVADNMFLSAAFDGLRQVRALDAMVDLAVQLSEHGRMAEWVAGRIAHTCFDMRDACAALDFFRLCVDRGWPVDHGVVTLTLRAALAAADLERAALTLQEAVGHGLIPTASDVHVVMDLCYDLREPSGALEFLLQCRELGIELNERHYQALANVRDAAEDADSAVAVLDLMREHEVQPSPILFGYLAGTAAKHGRPDLVHAVRRHAEHAHMASLCPDALVSGASHLRRLLSGATGAASVHATADGLRAGATAFADLLVDAAADRAHQPAIRNAILTLCSPLSEVDVRTAGRAALAVLEGACAEQRMHQGAADELADPWDAPCEGDGEADLDAMFGEFLDGGSAPGQHSRATPPPPPSPGARAATAGAGATPRPHQRVPAPAALLHTTLATVTRLLGRCVRVDRRLTWELLDKAQELGVADAALFQPVMGYATQGRRLEDALRVLRCMRDSGVRADAKLAAVTRKGLKLARREGREDEYRELAAAAGVSFDGGPAGSVRAPPARKSGAAKAKPSVRAMSERFRMAFEETPADAVGVAAQSNASPGHAR